MGRIVVEDPNTKVFYFFFSFSFEGGGGVCVIFLT